MLGKILALFRSRADQTYEEWQDEVLTIAERDSSPLDLPSDFSSATWPTLYEDGHSPEEAIEIVISFRASA